jgi:fluoroquinolone transport system permease protein
MRLKALIPGDIRFQFKYGFYFIYLLFTLLYIGLLYAFPASWREKAAVLMIFSDPAAMGLYFMGAIVLFERSERVLDSLAVSPVRPLEYVLSKLVSIGLISTLAGLAIAIPAGLAAHPFAFLSGVFLCSCLFSSIGLLLACRIATLNQFVLATIPAELLINVPAVLWLFWYRGNWLVIHPGVALLQLCSGGGAPLPALVSLLAWTALFAALACAEVGKMLRAVGGVKL